MPCPVFVMKSSSPTVGANTTVCTPKRALPDGDQLLFSFRSRGHTAHTNLQTAGYAFEEPRHALLTALHRLVHQSDDRRQQTLAELLRSSRRTRRNTLHA